MQQTLSIIKPDATERNIIGKVLSMIEDNGLKVMAMKKLRLTKEEAEEFYRVHEERPFFNDLVEFMTSAPIVVMAISADNGVNKYRKLMGATNPDEAEDGTIRKSYGLNIEKNTVHGSDSIENAKREIEYFFEKEELVG